MITVTSEHLKLLQAMYLRWEDCEYGAPAVDCKRPYGNSDVEADILELLGENRNEDYDDSFSRTQREYARRLHHEMLSVMQHLLSNLSIKVGDTVQFVKP